MNFYFLELNILNMFCLLVLNLYGNTVENVNNQAKYYYFLKNIPDQSKTKDTQFCIF